MRNAQWKLLGAMVLPVCVFLVLLVLGAKAHPLWADEAEIANFSRNILQFGVPTGWDGVNIIGSQHGIVLNSDLLNTSNSWLEMYLMAGSFSIFGVSSFTARLPFMIVSIVALILLYGVSRVYTSSSRVALFCISIASCSVPLLLYSYQARYLSLIMCFGLLVFLCMHRTVGGSLLGFIGRAVGIFGLLASNYFSASLLCLSVMATMAVGMIISPLKTRSMVIRFRDFLITFVIGTVAYLPVFFYFRPTEHRGFDFAFHPEAIVGFLAGSLLRIGKIYIVNAGYPIVFVLIASIFVFWFRSRSGSHMPFVFKAGLVFLACYMSILILVSALTIESSQYVWIGDFRYHILLFPVLYLLTSIWVDKTVTVQKRLGYCLLVAFIAFNGSWFMPRVVLAEYVRDTLFPYKTPDVAVAEYLLEHGNSNDAVFVNLERNLEPLIFHIGKKMRFVNRLDRTNTRFFPKNKKNLPSYIYNYREKPDWIIYYGKHNQDEYDYRRSMLIADVQLTTEYDVTVIPVYYQDRTRPELDTHVFSAVPPKFRDQVFIYKRKITAQ